MTSLAMGKISSVVTLISLSGTLLLDSHCHSTKVTLLKMALIYFCLFLNVDRNTLGNYFHQETRRSSLGVTGEDFQLSGFMHTLQNPIFTHYENLLRTVVMRNQEMNSALLNLEVV